MVRLSLRKSLSNLTVLAVLPASMLMAVPLTGYATTPIKIAVIAPSSAIPGKAVFQGAELAAQQINSHGGVNGRKIQLIKYDDHKQAADAVRGFQRAAEQNHVTAVVGAWISEIAIALEPWAARFHMPFIVTGGWATKLNRPIRNNYNKYKYIFRDTFNSVTGGEAVCAYSKDILVKQLHYKSADIVSENAAWTKPFDKELLKCLPSIGLKVKDHIRFSPSTNDFTPIYNKVEDSGADVIITGWGHVGVKPTIQWHQSQVPMLLAGWSAQAGASSFWGDTNGGTEGVVTADVASAKAALTRKTIPFANAYEREFKETPAYDAYSTYDAIYLLKNAIERANSTSANKIVNQLEKANYVGTQGRIVFNKKGARFVHGMKYGKGYVTGVAFQWQNGKQVLIWPQHVAQGHVKIPSFVKVK